MVAMRTTRHSWVQAQSAAAAARSLANLGFKFGLAGFQSRLILAQVTDWTANQREPAQAC